MRAFFQEQSELRPPHPVHGLVSDASYEQAVQTEIYDALEVLAGLTGLAPILKSLGQSGFKIKLKTFAPDDGREGYFSAPDRAIYMRDDKRINIFELAHELRHFWQYEMSSAGRDMPDTTCLSSIMFHKHCLEADAYAFMGLVFHKMRSQYGLSEALYWGRGTLRVLSDDHMMVGHCDASDRAFMMAAFDEYFSKPYPRNFYNKRMADRFEHFLSVQRLDKGTIRSDKFLSNYERFIRAFKIGGASYLEPALAAEKQGHRAVGYYGHADQIGFDPPSLKTCELTLRNKVLEIEEALPIARKKRDVGRRLKNVSRKIGYFMRGRGPQA